MIPTLKICDAKTYESLATEFDLVIDFNMDFNEVAFSNRIVVFEPEKISREDLKAEVIDKSKFISMLYSNVVSSEMEDGNYPSGSVTVNAELIIFGTKHAASKCIDGYQELDRRIMRKVFDQNMQDVAALFAGIASSINESDEANKR